MKFKSQAELDAYIDGLTPAQVKELLAKAKNSKPEWEKWVERNYPAAVRFPFAPYHRSLWEWGSALKIGIPPKRHRGEVWPRGGGKSTTLELLVCYWCAHATRRFVLVVCATQKQANKHVIDIADWRTRFRVP